MMDPITIISAVSVVAKLCTKIVQGLVVFDEAVKTFSAEINSLTIILFAIGNTFENPVKARSILSSPTTLQHWRNVQQMLSNCRETLEEFERIVIIATQGNPGLSSKPMIWLKLVSREPKIALIRQKLTAYKDMLNMSLQSVTLYVPENHHPSEC